MLDIDIICWSMLDAVFYMLDRKNVKLAMLDVLDTTFYTNYYLDRRINSLIFSILQI